MFYFNGSSAKLISEQGGLKIFSKGQENIAACVEELNKLVFAQKQNQLPPMRVMLH